MSLMTCELRCHILDRKDQLENAKRYLRSYDEKIKESLEKIQSAKEEHEKLLRHVERRKNLLC